MPLLSDDVDSGVGQSGDTLDTQSSPDKDAASTESAARLVETRQSVSQHAEEANDNVVTRA